MNIENSPGPYSRADAIADGMLVDVTHQGFAIGFKVPVAITRAAWALAIEWNDEDSNRFGRQDQSKRLRHVLSLCFIAARTHDTNKLTFQLAYLPRSSEKKPVSLVLKAVIEGDDESNPAVTIMLLDED